MSGWKVIAWSLFAAFVIAGGTARSQSGDSSMCASNEKNPQLAGTLSVFLPGLGHIYAGEPVKGAVLTGLFGAAIGAAVASDIGDTPGSVKPAGWASVIAIGGVYLYALIDAPFAAQRENASERECRCVTLSIAPVPFVRGARTGAGIRAGVQFSL